MPRPPDPPVRREEVQRRASDADSAESIPVEDALQMIGNDLADVVLEGRSAELPTALRAQLDAEIPPPPPPQPEEEEAPEIPPPPPPPPFRPVAEEDQR